MSTGNYFGGGSAITINLENIPQVSSLPDAAAFTEGYTVWLVADSTLYKVSSGAWVAAPSSGPGTGDVNGPASATTGDIATFADATGKVIANSSVNAASVVTGPSSATSGSVAVFNGTTGKTVEDTGVSAASIVNGPASATSGNLATFSDATGKTLSDSGRGTTNLAYVLSSTSNPTTSMNAANGYIANTLLLNTVDQTAFALFDATAGTWGQVGGVTPVTAAPTGTLGGVAPASTSLTDYPKTGSVTSGDYYVDAASGSDSNAGTLAAPFATIEHANSVVTSGQTVLVRAGTYTLTARIVPSVPYNLYGYGAERPIIDSKNLGSGSSSRTIYVGSAASGSAFKTGGFHIKGFWLVNSNSDTGVIYGLTGHYGWVEDCWISHYGTLTAASTGTSGVYTYNANGWLVQDCVMFRMGDGSTSPATNAGDAIGIGASSTASTGHKWVRCVAANMGDDGFDTFYGQGTEMIDCVSYQAGYYYTGSVAGDGNGFKAGGAGTPAGGGASIKGCLAVASRVENFTTNSGDPACSFVNCTAVDAGGYDFFAERALAHVQKDCIAYGGASGVWTGGSIVATYDTWTLGISNPLFANAAGGDYSLTASSPCIGVGSTGGDLGATDVALQLWKDWHGNALFTAASPA